MNYFNENIDFLQKHSRLISTTPESLEIFVKPESKWIDNLETILASGFQKNGIWYHSRRDPVREAGKQMDFICEDNIKHLIFLSSGIGYPLSSALEKNSIESALVLETNPEVLFYVLATVPVYKSKKEIFFYYCSDPARDTLEGILPFFQNKNINKTGFYKHRPAFQAEARPYSILENQVSGIIYKRSVNQATIIKFQSIWNKNLLFNIRQLVSFGTLDDIIKNFKARYKNIVICGAGPSLSQSYEDLLRYRNDFLLISADTAFFPLTKNGIIPDIVISADPQWINHYFVLSPDAYKSIWLLDPVVCYQSAHYLEKTKAKIFWWDSPFLMDQIIRDNKSRGEISHGGSVSTNAFDLALKLEPENLILTGQDLAFSTSLAHVKGSALESMIYFRNNRFSGFEMHNFGQLRAIPARKVEKTIGAIKNVYTNDKLLVFKNWFESQALKMAGKKYPVLYNSTESGTLLTNFSHEKLSAILTKNPGFLVKKPEFSYDFDSNFNKKSLLEKIVKLIDDCLEVQKLYKQNHEISETILKSYSNKNDLNRKLTDNDQKIKKFMEINQILSLNSQKIILSITELDAKNPEVPGIFYKLMYLSSKKLYYTLVKTRHILR